MNKANLWHKLEVIVDRFHEVEALLGDPETISDQDKFRNLSKEHHELQPLVVSYEKLQKVEEKIAETEELLKENDPELKQLAQDDFNLLKQKKKELVEKIQFMLLPKDPDDDRNIYIEIRAGAGGDEAGIFVGDLFKMYSRFAENNKWGVELMSSRSNEQGGFKEIIAKISGNSVYFQLKFESGVHRVQRVPVTESQGRIHTSTCTVAIMAEVEEIDEIKINTADLKIDTFRASGAGGQHVNKTDSAIRITHIPSGVVVECQDERSQHKNKAKALALLQSKLLASEQGKQKKEQDQTRKSMVGTGDRSERIRTYNYPQGRITDHRINLTIYKLDDVLSGDLAQIINPLMQESQIRQLAELGLS